MQIKIESAEILRLLSHPILYCKVQDFMKKYLITEYWPENDKYDYTNHENTICLSFVNGKTFNKRYSLPLINRFANPLAAEMPKGNDYLILTSICFRQGFKGNLPLGLSLDMDDTAISQTLQKEPIGDSIREPSLQALENGITCITWHVCPYILLDVLHEGTNPHVFQFSLIENWQVEDYDLYAEYPDYVRKTKKPWYHYFI